MNKIGKQAEHLVSKWLRKKKVSVLSNNYYCRQGEIDIIAMDKNTLCFIEVKYRKSGDYGIPEETVTAAKQRRIIKTAQAYLCQYSKYADLPARFDVVSVTGDLNNPVIDWQKCAFMMPA